jgi:hypothetical protein
MTRFSGDMFRQCVYIYFFGIKSNVNKFDFFNETRFQTGFEPFINRICKIEFSIPNFFSLQEFYAQFDYSLFYIHK